MATGLNCTPAMVCVEEGRIISAILWVLLLMRACSLNRKRSTAGSWKRSPTVRIDLPPKVTFDTWDIESDMTLLSA